MISKTEMLENADKISYKLTEVLLTWVRNEGNNLQSFIENPSGHVNYNQYVILDYSKLMERLKMLRDAEEALYIVTQYKEGNTDYTRSMYEACIDGVDIQLMDRLLTWMEKRYSDMTELIVSSGNAQEPAPIDDYSGMFSFNIRMFSEEYEMYRLAIEGARVIVKFKEEQLNNVYGNDGEDIVEQPVEDVEDTTNGIDLDNTEDI